MRYTHLNLLALMLTVMIGSTPLFSQKWQRMPIVPQWMLDEGYMGGEGGQWPRAIEYSTDPDFLLFLTDVGGIFRSLDGGENWQISMVGWNARGGNDVVIDPYNPDRCIGIGGNSDSDQFGTDNGLYLSDNRAASWKQVHFITTPIGGKLAYDASSYDEAAAYCMVAYYASPDRGLWKTIDGGSKWTRVNAAFNDCLVKVHPTLGYVYLARDSYNDPGFFKSMDGGVSFEKKYDKAVSGMDVILTQPGKIFLSGPERIVLSDDAGETFTYPSAAGLPTGKPLEDLVVSPADANRMLVWHQGANWNWQKWYSHDGGASWKDVTFDHSRAVLPYNTRNGFFTWHPTDPNVVFGIGGDWITKSTDGGVKFSWSGNGENAIMVGGGFNFSPGSPNTLMLGFQDYNGAFTLNGGESWDYRDVSGKGWGGFCYGGFALDSSVMWVGDADSWGGNRELRITYDGGDHWTTLDHDYGGPDISYASPNNRNIAFASDLRTTDRGLNWQRMEGCQGVFTSNPKGEKELYGQRGNDIVVSYNKGASWSRVTTVPGGFTDLAYDHSRDRFFVASGDRLKLFEHGVWSTLETPKHQYNGHRIGSVAVDPLYPNIVYAGTHGDIFTANNSVIRSTDGGLSWENLHVNEALSDPETVGPHEVGWLRVHPQTRELWVSGGCFGMWRIAAPQYACDSTIIRIELSSPEYNEYVLTDSVLTLSVNITLPGSGIDSVTYYSGSRLLGSVSQEPWELEWSPVNAGINYIQALTVDSEGSCGSSEVVQINVGDGVPELSLRLNDESYYSADTIFVRPAVEDPLEFIDSAQLVLNDEVVQSWDSIPFNTELYGLEEQEHDLYIRAFSNGEAAWYSDTSHFQVMGILIPENPENTRQGVLFSYYEGYYTVLPDFGKMTPKKKGIQAGFTLDRAALEDHYAFLFETYIDIQEEGKYTFYTTSDDGSRLWIGDKLVVDNDGLHGSQVRLGMVLLTAGQYTLRVGFFEDAGDAVLKVEYEAPGGGRQQIPAGMLGYEYDPSFPVPVVNIISGKEVYPLGEEAVIQVETDPVDLLQLEIRRDGKLYMLLEKAPYSFTMTSMVTKDFEIEARAYTRDLAMNVAVQTISFSKTAGVDEVNQAVLKIYPQPTSDLLYFDYPGQWSTAKVEVYDLRGSLLFSEFSTERKQMDVTFLGNGIYFISICTPSATLRSRFVVVR